MQTVAKSIVLVQVLITKVDEADGADWCYAIVVAMQGNEAIAYMLVLFSDIVLKPVN